MGAVSSGDDQGSRLSFEKAMAWDVLPTYTASHRQVAQDGTLLVPVGPGIQRVLRSESNRCNDKSSHYLMLRIYGQRLQAEGTLSKSLFTTNNMMRA